MTCGNAASYLNATTGEIENPVPTLPVNGTAFSLGFGVHEFVKYSIVIMSVAILILLFHIFNTDSWPLGGRRLNLQVFWLAEITQNDWSVSHASYLANDRSMVQPEIRI